MGQPSATRDILALRIRSFFYFVSSDGYKVHDAFKFYYCNIRILSDSEGGWMEFLKIPNVVRILKSAANFG